MNKRIIKNRNRLGLVLLSSFVFSSSVWAVSSFEVSPTVFDFGWSPENAIISCDFKVKNTGADVLALTSVQPSCGCTATNFTPEDLTSSAEKTIAMTFNTKGYGGLKFNKSVKVKAGNPETEVAVQLAGSVLDSQAKVVPIGSGIVSFEPGSKEKKQKVQSENKSGEDLTLRIVQSPTGWAKIKLSEDLVKVGQKVSLDVELDGSVDDLKNTSVTIEGKGATASHRLTIAVRTGPAPVAPLRITPPSSGPSPSKKDSNKKK